MISELYGKTIVAINKSKDDDQISFICSDGAEYIMNHSQSCCEQVRIEDIVGELDDLLNAPILMAEETTNDSDTDSGIMRWTFYKLATHKGYVTIRWCGTSNGWYSVGVDFFRANEMEEE